MGRAPGIRGVRLSPHPRPAPTVTVGGGDDGGDRRQCQDTLTRSVSLALPRSRYNAHEVRTSQAECRGFESRLPLHNLALISGRHPDWVSSLVSGPLDHETSYTAAPGVRGLLEEGGGSSDQRPWRSRSTTCPGITPGPSGVLPLGRHCTSASPNHVVEPSVTRTPPGSSVACVASSLGSSPVMSSCRHEWPSDDSHAPASGPPRTASTR